MPPIPKIVAFVEGHGDEKAVPILAKGVLKDIAAGSPVSSPVNISHEAWRVGHHHKLLKQEGKEWIRLLGTAVKRGAAAVLLVLDGDRLENQCPVEQARRLVELAKSCGAGKIFSVAVVFAMQEIESWFIPDADALLKDGAWSPNRRGQIISVPGDPEKSPRDAKRWLSENMADGYKPTIHQAEFAKRLNIATVRSQNLRSFRRFENAVTALSLAVISGEHVATP